MAIEFAPVTTLPMKFLLPVLRQRYTGLLPGARLVGSMQTIFVITKMWIWGFDCACVVTYAGMCQLRYAGMWGRG